MFNVDDYYIIGMVNKNTGGMTFDFVGSNTHSFYRDYSSYSSTLGYNAYFFVDGSAGAEVSITGYMDTY